MKNNLLALFVGFLFALGLGISGMTQPQRVVGFLYVTGVWDPSLLFVMIGAIAVHFSFYKIVAKRKAPIFAKEWYLPTDKSIPPSLIIGSTIFGVGWGIGGYCPGPALVSLTSFSTRSVIFVGCMIAGMLVFKLLDSRFHFRR
ncbi:MAG: DUF6691 family protein [Bdellovibrionota bacterium]